MEDKKYMNTEGIKTLAIDDLESVAGGRRTLRPNELRDLDEVSGKVSMKKDSLRMSGRSKQADALERQYQDAYEEWINDIKTLPEDSGDLLLSDYIEVW